MLIVLVAESRGVQKWARVGPGGPWRTAALRQELPRTSLLEKTISHLIKTTNPRMLEPYGTSIRAQDRGDATVQQTLPKSWSCQVCGGANLITLQTMNLG